MLAIVAQPAVTPRKPVNMDAPTLMRRRRKRCVRNWSQVSECSAEFVAREAAPEELKRTEVSVGRSSTRLEDAMRNDMRDTVSV